MHQPGEPSVEEILDSIKKVIARDNRDGAIAERRRRAQETAHEADVRHPPEPADAEEAEEVLELDEDAMMALEEGAGMDEDGNAGEEPSPLIADWARDSMRANFEALATLSKPGASPQIVRSGETSLEGLVRDMLRPMLAEWLDANLPSMVEELVKDEIARIAGKRK